MHHGIDSARSVDELPEDVQQRMIEKLLGKVNAERIKTTKANFRPMPIIVTYEFYKIGSQLFRNWRIDRIENGRKEPHLSDLTEESCQSEVNALKARGFNVRPVTIGFQSNKKRQSRAASSGSRKGIIDQLKDFRV